MLSIPLTVLATISALAMALVTHDYRAIAFYEPCKLCVLIWGWLAVIGLFGLAIYSV